ncbi:leucine zipper protein, partial [Trifolium medium]|nr:leucine zipper protein [Trifolium medium]
MNGKPDAYSLISCAAFAIMSLSLSRQTQCGFEIDLLYFFLGCLIVQLMKIKLQLFIIGAGFSYSLIILRSFLSSIDARGDNQYSQLQDENSVILYMNSLQLANIDIASASDSNRIDSTQLVTTNDISSVMEQLMAFVKALHYESVILVQMIVEHVQKYYAKKQSQFVFTDPNFMMDAFKLETIKGLEKTAKVM